MAKYKDDNHLNQVKYKKVWSKLHDFGWTLQEIEEFKDDFSFGIWRHGPTRGMPHNSKVDKALLMAFGPKKTEELIKSIIHYLDNKKDDDLLPLFYHDKGWTCGNPIGFAAPAGYEEDESGYTIYLTTIVWDSKIGDFVKAGSAAYPLAWWKVRRR